MIATATTVLSLNFILFALANAIANGALVWSVLCRAAKSNGDAHPAVRRAFTVLVIGCLVSATIPFTHPQYLIASPIALALSFAYVQKVTGRFWHAGTPSQFQLKSHLTQK
jgi:ABC-type uncharacterized transport system YnjBCD permease subunit